MTATTGRELTADERAALARYIAQHGRTWKADVRRMWANSNPRTEDERYLYTLRNSPSYGPRWLVRFKPDLNAVAAAASAMQRDRIGEWLDDSIKAFKDAAER